MSEQAPSSSTRVQNGVIVMFCDGTYARLRHLSGFAARTVVETTPNINDADLLHEHDFRQSAIARQLREIGVAAILTAKAVVERKVTLERMSDNSLNQMSTDMYIAEKAGVAPPTEESP